MLKTTTLANLAPRALGIDDNEAVKVGGRADKTVRNLSKSKRLKNTKSKIPTHINIGAMGESTFLTPSAKKGFNCLKQMFIKALILRYFDLENYIWIQIDVLSYAIGRVLSQLSTD